MTIQTLGKELWRMITKNKVTIIGTILILLSIFTALQFLLNSGNDPMKKLSSDSKAAQFDIYIEDDTEGTYINSFLVEELIKDNEVVEDIESETNLDIQSSLDEFAQDHEVTYTEDDPINIERQRSSNIMFVKFDIGNEEENLLLANAYYEWFKEAQEENAFFDNKKIFYIEKPRLLSINDEVSENESGNGNSIVMIIVQAVIVAIVGLIIGIVISIIIAMLQSVIKYSFTYGWSINDQFISFNNEDNEDLIINSILRTNRKNIILLSEKEIPILNKVKKNNLKNIMVYSDFSEIPLDKNIEEVVILIEKNSTSKKWYNLQRKELGFYEDLTIKIVEI